MAMLLENTQQSLSNHKKAVAKQQNINYITLRKRILVTLSQDWNTMAFMGHAN